MRLIEIIVPVLLLVPSFFIVRLIDKKLIDELPRGNIFKKYWDFEYFFVILAVVFILNYQANMIIREPWVNTPPLANILNQNEGTLRKYSMSEIEISTRTMAMEFYGGELIKYRGTNANVIDGYEIETNVEDFYVTEIYLLKGFRARYIDGKWIAEVPKSVITRDLEEAKKQVEKLLDSIDKHFKNSKEKRSTWE